VSSGFQSSDIALRFMLKKLTVADPGRQVRGPEPSLQHWRPWAKQCTEARGHTNFNGQLNKICRCRPYLYCNYSNFKLLVLISTV